MKFREESIKDFLELFHRTYPQIRFFKGCLFLELHRDANQTETFFTISKWESAEALENYRKSDLFRNTWSITSGFFDDKPMAWSLEKIVDNQINP